MSERVEKVMALAKVLSAVKDSFIPDRNVKDELVVTTSDLLLKELRKLKEEL